MLLVERSFFHRIQARDVHVRKEYRIRIFPMFVLCSVKVVAILTKHYCIATYKLRKGAAESFSCPMEYRLFMLSTYTRNGQPRRFASYYTKEEKNE
jgi:hypothetical protein